MYIQGCTKREGFNFPHTEIFLYYASIDIISILLCTPLTKICITPPYEYIFLVPPSINIVI